MATSKTVIRFDGETYHKSTRTVVEVTTYLTPVYLKTSRALVVYAHSGGDNKSLAKQRIQGLDSQSNAN